MKNSFAGDMLLVGNVLEVSKMEVLDNECMMIFTFYLLISRSLSFFCI
jgi:hypothetical protein